MVFRRSPLDRTIARLAVPALGALIAEPLFLLVDAALVGHLGAAELAGVSIASAVLQTAFGLLIFLAYTTTPLVARRLGAGLRASAIHAGIDGVWLAVALGAVLVALGLLFGPAVVGFFGAPDAVTDVALTYLTLCLWGIPAVLVTFAATGLLRGLQDTITPLVIAGAGFALNAVLNVVLIYGLGLGVAGAAVGTVIANWAMAAGYLVVVARIAHRERSSLAPQGRGMLAAANAGGWLLLRTASLRAAMVATIVVGTQFGVAELAALHIALTLFGAVALVLDSLAIAGQALVGEALGASDPVRVRAVSRRLLELSILVGVGVGVVIAALSRVTGPLFSGDPAVHGLLTAVLLLMALGLPLAGVVFVLDGVLIGAGDARYLALAGLVNIAVYAPLLALVAVSGLHGTAALLALWLAFGLGYLGTRAVTLGLRFRRDAWMVTGAA